MSQSRSMSSVLVMKQIYLYRAAIARLFLKSLPCESVYVTLLKCSSHWGINSK